MDAAGRKRQQRAREKFPRRQWEEVEALNRGTDKACKALGVDPSDAADVAEDLMPRLQALARRYTVHSFRKILELVGSDDPRVAFAASVEVLARGWGRAPQLVQVTHQQGLTREQLEARIADALGRLHGRLVEVEQQASAGQDADDMAKDCPPAQVIEKTGA